MGVTIAVCYSRAAGGTGAQTAIDPVAVGVIGDDEHALIGMCCDAAENNAKNNANNDARNSRSRGDNTQWLPQIGEAGRSLADPETSQCGASVPIPKFATPRGMLLANFGIEKDTSKLIILV